MMKDTIKNFGKFMTTSWEELATMTPVEQRKFWTKTMLVSGIAGLIGYGISKYIGRKLYDKAFQKIQEDIDAMVRDIESQTKPWGDDLDDAEYAHVTDAEVDEIVNRLAGRVITESTNVLDY